MAQLVDGIILGAVGGLIFFLFSQGRLYSIWVSPMFPQFILEFSTPYSPGPFDFLWGGAYFSYTLPYGKTMYFGYPAPLLWIIYAIYYTYFTTRFGQTPGKMIKGLVVLTEEQSFPSPFISFKRWVGYLVSFLPLGLGFWWMEKSTTKQCWHDHFTRTAVYYFED